jgi:hypothetical protein
LLFLKTILLANLGLKEYSLGGFLGDDDDARFLVLITIDLSIETTRQLSIAIGSSQWKRTL